jgi:hypothetical protein
MAMHYSIETNIISTCLNFGKCCYCISKNEKSKEMMILSSATRKMVFALIVISFFFSHALFAQTTIFPFNRTSIPSTLQLTGTDSTFDQTFDFQNTDTASIYIVSIVLDSANAHFIVEPRGVCTGLPMTVKPGQLMAVGIDFIVSDTNTYHNGLRFVLGNAMAPIIYPIEGKSRLLAPAITDITLDGLLGGIVNDGATLNISWVSVGNIGSGFNVEFSIDSGMTWNMIKSVAPDTTSVQWTNTLIRYYQNCFIRVKSYDADKANVLKQSERFTIGEPAGVNILISNQYSISNYPNPLLKATKFWYSLTESGLVNLAIYDVMGREVSCPISNKIEDAGIYSTDYDASHLANGSYTYVLTIGSKRVIGKMDVVK